jgi:catechol 2,3-dioxygenase-like lactoylglutathione lyase family enzyme
MRRIGDVALLVRDYDEAIAYYVGILGFTLVEDREVEAGKRWVRVSPGEGGAGLVLARAASDDQIARIGNQAGGRVFLFLETNDFERDYSAYRAGGVKFLEAPRQEEYGTVAVFEDLHGNRWDLIEPNR